uniref:Uncharacterized protein n=1 Tax=Apteryx owenii TaxID=8824 RepID=A0A8B9NXJ4_APTOW
ASALVSWVISSRLLVAAGAASTAAFFLCEGLLGQHFEVVPNGVAKPQPGDLFLFPLASAGPGWWGAHAGVYCGDGEIIHLEGDVYGTWLWRILFYPSWETCMLNYLPEVPVHQCTQHGEQTGRIRDLCAELGGCPGDKGCRDGRVTECLLCLSLYC